MKHKADVIRLIDSIQSPKSMERLYWFLNKLIADEVLL